tara:strand:+ start:247 stop:504 length:258 start_codon:yes stop_codon:yes gene_type:complete
MYDCQVNIAVKRGFASAVVFILNLEIDLHTFLLSEAETFSTIVRFTNSQPMFKQFRKTAAEARLRSAIEALDTLPCVSSSLDDVK